MKKALIIGLLLLAGCATPFGTYMKDRGNDFADIFKADIGYGLGIDAHVIATDFIATGAGASATSKIGFKGRYVDDWKDYHIGIPILPFIEWMNTSQCGGAHVDWCITDVAQLGTGKGGTVHEDSSFPSTGSMSILFVNTIGFVDDKKPLLDKFDLECSATAGVIGVHIGFSPGQLFDFVFGWTGMDIGKDDTKDKEKSAKMKNKNKTQ